MSALPEQEILDTLELFSLTSDESNILLKLAHYFVQIGKGITVHHLFLQTQMPDQSLDNYFTAIRSLLNKKLIKTTDNLISPDYDAIQEFLTGNLAEKCESAADNNIKRKNYSVLTTFFSAKDASVPPTDSVHYMLSKEFETKFGKKSLNQVKCHTVDLPKRKMRFMHSQFVYSSEPVSFDNQFHFKNQFEAVRLTLDNQVALAIIEFFSCEQKMQCNEEIHGYFLRNIDGIAKEFLFGTAFPKTELKFKAKIASEQDRNKIILKITGNGSEQTIFVKSTEKSETEPIIYFIWSNNEKNLPC